ncbi:MAG: helix-turn-helix transcriptional regulator [Ferruginibacter sp.]|nr:helix-turn-helix transcriptional regulator [Bacteroidota bacterium]MBX2920084.1 helix-turn-helix transcriptional regulator [Ferruginibacter sp.]
MSTNYNNPDEIKSLYSSNFFSNKKTHSEVKHLAQMLMYRFLSEIEKITDERKIVRKELAKQIGVSASYLTQLYRGVKPLNIETLAKIELVLDFRFDIKAIEKSLLEVNDATEFNWNEEQINNFIQKFSCKNGFWIYKNHSKSNGSKEFDKMKEVDYSTFVKTSTPQNKLRIA